MPVKRHLVQSIKSSEVSDWLEAGAKQEGIDRWRQHKLLVTPGPHIREGVSTPGIMMRRAHGAFPAAISGIYFFGLKAAVVMISSTSKRDYNVRAVIQRLKAGRQR